MTSRQFAEWLAYSNVEPFGEQRADLRSAIIACVTANVWRGKGQKALKPEDFMPFRENPEKAEVQQTMQQQQNIFERINKAAQGRKGKL